MLKYTIMDDIKNLLKGTVDKFKETFGKKEISLSEAFEQMDADIEAAEKAYGKPFFPEDTEMTSPDEHFLRIMGYKDAKSVEEIDFDKFEARYLMLQKKFNPENFKSDEETFKKAQKRMDLVNQAYLYLKNKHNEE